MNAADPQALEARLRKLETQGSLSHDPLGHRLVEALLKRAGQASEQTRIPIAERADTALVTLETGLQQARAEAEQALAEIARRAPRQLATAEAMLEGHQFRQLARLRRRLDGAPAASPLTELLASLAATHDSDPARESAADEASAPGAAPLPAWGELRTGAQLRERLQRLAAGRLVARAARAAPDDAGPLNPQRLATDSLAAMGRLSPAYLGRYVSWLDTLFRLEAARPQD